MNILLTFQDVTLGYERHPAIHHLSGSLHVGSLTAIIGPNGAGKSTLLKGIAGLIRPFTGKIITEQLQRKDIAYLSQQTEIDRNFPISVFDMIQMGQWHQIGAFRGTNSKLIERVLEVLNIVGLNGFEKRLIGSLSTGQFQRVLFARLLLQDARLVLLDEPFSVIDSRTTIDLLNIINLWHKEGRTVVTVLHDFEQVRKHFPETLLLARELVAWGPTADVFAPENLLRARAMAEAWDDTAPFCKRDN